MQIVIPPRSTVAIFPFMNVMTRGIVVVSKRAVLDRMARLTGPRSSAIRGSVAWADQSSQEETDQFFQCLAVFCHPAFSQWYDWWFELECDYMNSKLRTYRADIRAICRVNHISVERRNKKDHFAVPWSLLYSSSPSRPRHHHRLVLDATSPFDSLERGTAMRHYRLSNLAIDEAADLEDLTARITSLVAAAGNE